jgi:hypothetical protein
VALRLREIVKQDTEIRSASGCKDRDSGWHGVADVIPIRP